MATQVWGGKRSFLCWSPYLALQRPARFSPLRLYYKKRAPSISSSDAITAASEHEVCQLEGQELLRDKCAVTCLVNSAEVGEDNHTNVNFLEVKLDLKELISKMPLVLDIKNPKRSRRLRQIQRTYPCSNRINFHDYIMDDDINIPTDMTAPGIVFKSSKHKKTTKSIDNLTTFSVECSPDEQSELRYDSVEGIMKRIGLTEMPLPFDPLRQAVGMNHIRSRLTSTKEMKSSNLASSSRICRLLAKPLRKHGSEAKFSQESICSCSTTRSISSYQSSSPSDGFVTSAALLHCVWEGNIPYFLFVVDDDGCEVYMARPQKIRAPVDKPLDYIYQFHSWKASRKKWKKIVIDASSHVGKMKVSSSLIVNSDRSKFMETEFVLFGAKEEERSTEMKKSLSNFRRINRRSKKAAKIFRPTHMSRHNPVLKVDESGHFANEFPPNLELTAIVVRDYGYNSSKGAAFGGWGLKFLEKVETDDANFSQEYPSSSSESCENTSKSVTKKISRNVTVLVPAGFHGGPITRSGGPSSLTERWKSSGHCDCGGWDVGCPIEVLNNDSICSKVLPEAESEEDCKPFELFIEGGKHTQPTLQMLNVSKDLYVVNFQSKLSALQSFSIGVAFIHSQTPELYPKL
ncbi:hypothetical protein OPV22_010152 [Ensete ventricosum]|uniref:DUF3527 domain-containing protein n=1 Tax=Ensete ventricosum TaxID=4639 RepID=A0AAV8PTL8_ENSVE|nr:hypothetical protein OPV22_010152 [Ensete ventricosum]